jgi:hypothetical protein
MALTSYACFEGQKRGVMPVAPRVDAPGASRRGSPWVELESFELHPEVPFESKPSKLKGVRTEYPLIITQEFGPISTWLEQAAREEEVLSSIIIETVSFDRHGFEQIERRISLTDVSIGDVRAHTGIAAATGRVFIDFSFTFEGIFIQGEEE